MVNQVMKDLTFPCHYASADFVTTGHLSWISAQWEIARIRMAQEHSANGLLILDEIQKLENWSEQVKKEWDIDTFNGSGLKVVLLGSSRLLLQKGLTESMAGRFETIYMEHWSYTEMRQAFDADMNHFIWFGGYPGTRSFWEDEFRWKQYVRDSIVETSISRDVLMLTRVDKPSLLKQLFGLGCLYSGQVLSFNKILGQLHDAGNTTTLSHYVDLLDTAGLLGGIEKYSVSVVKQRASSPKFLVYNTSLLTAGSDLSLGEASSKPEIWGRWIESAIGAHLLNHRIKERYSLYYWRDGNDEVDFVLVYKGKMIGLEVKGSIGGLKKGADNFVRKFRPYKMLLIGKDGIPVEEFLQINPVELF